MLNNLISSSLKLLFPYFCVPCGRPTRSEVVCLRCTPVSEEIDFNRRCIRCFSFSNDLDIGSQCELCRLYPLPIEQIRFLWRYEGAAQQLISILKYKPSLALCKYAARMAGKKINLLFRDGEFDAMVSIPASPGTLFQRGFSVSDEIGFRLQRELVKGLPFFRNALVQCKKKKVQASLLSAQRFNNVRGSFAANSKKVNGKRILLIDDVMTSGATCAAAATALLNAGAVSVSVFVLARSGTFNKQRARLSGTVW